MSEAVPVSLGPREGQTIRNPLGGDMSVKLTKGETGGSLTMFESVAAPGEGPPMHVHANEEVSSTCWRARCVSRYATS